MERFAIKKMLAWKQSSRRKPLILKGVRQVGKTWILKEFGKRYYKNVAYFNFDERKLFKNPRAKPDGTKMFCSAFLNDARMCCFFANAIVKY